MTNKTFYWTILIFIVSTMFTVQSSMASSLSNPIIIGLDADLSAGSAQAGQSIYRGALIAIDEINKNGGVLGRTLSLEIRDHRGNPARAMEDMAELADLPDLVAVLGGPHTPAALEVLPLVHERKILFLIPWAAGTPIIHNGYHPNFVFRISICDAHAGPFLVEAALSRGFKRLGLLLENTGWGRSNEKSMNAAAVAWNLPSPVVQWFNWGVSDLKQQINTFQNKKIEAILLVSNPPEGVVLVKTMAKLPPAKHMPIISHWGITGGRLPEQAGKALDSVDLCFLQTFNFALAPFPERAAALFASYQQLFPGIYNPLDIPAAPGLAHAYDLVHILAKAIIAAGTSDPPTVGKALEKLKTHSGVMADYSPPFTPSCHDALGTNSFMLARYNSSGQVIPILPEGK